MIKGSPTDDGLAMFIESCQAATTKEASLHAHPTLNSSGMQRIVALQPHPDDVALSVGGLLARSEANVTLLTVFGDSLNSEVAVQRAAEDARFAHIIGATHCNLRFLESASCSSMSNRAPIDEAVRKWLYEEQGRALLIAPAAVSRHPDHRMIQQLAMDLGCGVFWEDVAFWGIYGSSIDDRILFSCRNELPLAQYTLVAIDVSSQIEMKAIMLASYGSQSADTWRPLRYAWTAAREINAPFEFCERLLVHDEYLARVEQLVGGFLKSAGTLQYGTSKVRVAWIDKI
jgi:LmbE family N-acetylglucosaminyl deacetylase